MPKKFESPFVAYIIGPPEFERYVIKDNRVEHPRFFTGTDDEAWTDDLRTSRKYFNIDALSEALQGLARRELSHLTQRTYRMDVEVTVIGEATEDQVREYIYGALTIGLDYDSHGPGPTAGSYVMVKTHTAGLRPVNDG